MKLINRKYTLIILVMILTSIFMQGCGIGGDAGSAGGQVAVREYKKTVTDLKITPDYAPNAYLTDMTDSLCYFGVEIVEESEEEEYSYDWAFYYQSLDTPGEPVFITQTEGTRLLGMDAYADASGQEILCVLTLEDENGILTEYDNNGTQIKQIMISDEEFMRSRPGSIVRCQDGSYIVYNSKEMYLLEDSGDVIGRQECPGSYFQNVFQFNNGTVYTTYMSETSTENYLSKVNLKNGALSEKQSLPCAGDWVCEGENGQVLLMDGKALYCYDMATQEAETIVETTLYNIFKEGVRT